MIPAGTRPTVMVDDAVSSPSNAPVAIEPGSFDHSAHFYPRVPKTPIHPLVDRFLHLGNQRIADLYLDTHPSVDPQTVRTALAAENRYFRWAGCDLIATTRESGKRQILVIETNSCPSGQKSMPFSCDGHNQTGYQLLLERAFLPILEKQRLPEGGLAVLYDKNPMEASGYASAMAGLTGETVWLTPCLDGDPDPATRFRDDLVLEIRSPDRGWRPIRAAWRYVTQRPWNRIPLLTDTAIVNPVLSCLAGGRNKMLAAKAYEQFNSNQGKAGLAIRTPETICEVTKNEVPHWVERMGGFAVVKVPYRDAGQGIFTIASAEDLTAFLRSDLRYDRFIVQEMIGHGGRCSKTAIGRRAHGGTVPNRDGEIFAFDLRFMIGNGPRGFSPMALFGRRARVPLSEHLGDGGSSWDMLGTNLSIRPGPNTWETDTERLLLADTHDFDRLGLGLDDLIEAYVLTVAATSAIESMTVRLVTGDGKVRRRLFRSLNPDQALENEIL